MSVNTPKSLQSTSHGARQPISPDRKPGPADKASRQNYWRDLLSTSFDRVNGLVKEVHDEGVRKYGLSEVRGMFVDPALAAANLRDLSAGVQSAGGYTVHRATSGQTATWTIENGPVVDPNAGSISSSTVKPAYLVTVSDQSNQWITQSSTSLRNAIDRLVLQPGAVAIDNAAINGLGPSSNQPLGLLQTPVNAQGQSDYNKLSYSGVTFGGVAPTWAKVTSLLSAVENANVPTQGIKFLTSPNAKNVMLNTPILTGYPKFLWCEEKETVAGRPALVSTNVSTSQLIAGDFSKFLVLFWGMFVETDRYTLASNFQTRVVVTWLVNVLPLYGTAFAVSIDAV